MSDAERLRAAGHLVTLADDQQLPLIFDFDAWVELEKKWGELPNISARLMWGTVTDEGMLAPLPDHFDTVLTFVAAGLRHTGMTVEEVKKKILLSELKNYQTAVNDAVMTAFPAPEGKAEGEETTGSTGTGSTTSPPSDTAEPTESSGG